MSTEIDYDLTTPWMGIDFGTCRSAAAVLIGNDSQMVGLGYGGDGRNSDMPTAVYIEPDGRFRVGEEAVNSRAKDRSRFFDRFKLDIGKSQPIEINSGAKPQQYFYRDLVAAVLNHIRLAAETQFNNGQPLTKVILTVPAIYIQGGPEWTAMEAAAKQAKFTAIRIVREPEAAAIYYDYVLRLTGLAGDASGKLTLVYDLGGGTFDPALIRRMPEGYRVEGAVPGGGVKCGGIFFDQKIRENFAAQCREILAGQFRELKRNEDGSIAPEDVAEARRQAKDWMTLEKFIVDVKHRFSMPDVQDVNEPEPLTYSVDYQLTRGQFNSMIGPLLDDTVACCLALVKRSGIQWIDLTRIIMVGGSCHLPLVREKLEQMLKSAGAQGVEICWRRVGQTDRSIDPKFAVCLGAAMSLDQVTMTRIGDNYSLGRGVGKNDEQAVAWYRKAADQGYAEAQVKLAKCYLDRRGLKPGLTDEGIAGEIEHWYSSAGLQGDSNAWQQIGDMRQTGKGLSTDVQKAILAYEKGLELGNTGCMKRLGEVYSGGAGVPADPQKGFTYHHKAALAGDKDAQREVAKYYADGEGNQQALPEAAQWFRKAADQGDTYSQFRLGACYLDSVGLPKDPDKGAYWMARAAEQGDPAAQNRLGLCFDGGIGLPENAAEAVKWYRLAAEQSHAYAQYNLALSYSAGTGVEQDDRLAAEWFLKSAELGVALAQNRIGICYLEGKGVTANASEAIKWFTASAEQGYEWAQYNLGVRYLNGEGVEKSVSEAAKWLGRGAYQDNVDACVMLGALYLDATQYDDAIPWLTKAADAGDSSGMKMLGYLNAFGLGVKQDRKAARAWYTKAAEAGHTEARQDLIELWILTALESSIGSLPRMHLYQGLGAKVFSTARETYGSSFSETERVLLVYDDTVFGKADDGFIVTSHGIGFHEFTEASNYYPFAKLNQVALTVIVNKACIRLDKPLRPAVAQALANIAIHAASEWRSAAGAEASSPSQAHLAIGHSYNGRGVCSKCGRSKTASEAFGWACA